MTEAIPRPPKHLGPGGRGLWRRVMGAYELEEEHQRALLAEAASCVDRLAECRVRIAEDGMVQADRFGNLRPHPLLATERDARASLARLLRELSLDVDTVEETRPPLIRGGFRYGRGGR